MKYQHSPAHRSAYEAGRKAAREGLSARFCPYWGEGRAAFRRAWFRGRYDYLTGDGRR